MEGPACLLAFCNLVLPLAPCPCACLKLWAPPLPGATDGVWLVCNKHLAVVKVSQSLVLVPDGVCGLRPGHVARPGRAGSMQSFCRIPVFTRLHQAMPLIPPPKTLRVRFHMRNASCLAAVSVGGLGEAQVHSFFFFFFTKKHQRKFWKGTATPKIYKQRGL